MKISHKIKLEDLYFGYKQFGMSYDNTNTRSIKTYNLFDSSRVLRSVAMYVLMTPEQRKERVKDPLSWCFNDVWGRYEYEFMMSPLGGGGEPQKVDIYQMYVEPNRELLLDLVSRVTKSSAKKYLSEERKRYRRCR